MKETGAKQAGFTHAQRYTRCTDLSAARLRTYSAEVTGFHRNLPHHRRLRPDRRLTIIPKTSPAVNTFFQLFSIFFLPFLSHTRCVVCPEKVPQDIGKEERRKPALLPIISFIFPYLVPFSSPWARRRGERPGSSRPAGCPLRRCRRTPRRGGQTSGDGSAR